MADVSLIDVSKRFGEIDAVEDLTLHVEDGAFVVLLGPTGAGKTTTLRLAAGLETPDRGEIRIGDHDVSRVAAGRPRRRLCVSAIFALSALHGLRQPGVSSALSRATSPRGRDPQEGDGNRGDVAD